MKKKILLILSALLGILLFTGCPSPTEAPTVSIPSTIVFADGATVSKQIGSGNYTNTVTGDGTGSITYTSGTEATATVNSSTGEVTLLAAGTTVITAVKAASGTYASVTNTYTLTVTLYIGMPYQGGKVAYFFESGDTGYVDGETHGLIAAIADQSTGIVWISGGSTSSEFVNGSDGTGTSTAIGTGQANTTAIIAQAVAANNNDLATYAAGICNAYINDSFSDWFLPSEDELNKLYLKKADIGGFESDTYWSSSEYSNGTAWKQSFYDGSQYYGNKDSDGYVRPVRAF